MAMGLSACFHGDELNDLKCGELAAHLGARSVSHLEELSPAGIASMARSGVFGVLLPTTAYTLRLRSPPARKMIDAGVPIALASDFNPNAHCLDMPTTMNLACVTLGMTMAEAVAASTLNAAAALGLGGTLGSIEVGKAGDLLVLDAPGWEHIVYQMQPSVTNVFKGGLSLNRDDGAALLPPSDFGMRPAETLDALAAGIPFAKPPELPAGVLYPAVPHAPDRRHGLDKAGKRLAVTNALRYFPAEMHDELAPEFLTELESRGHIYMYRFRPASSEMKARHIGQYPAKSRQAAAIMMMIQNNLDPAVAQYPHELITYGGNGSVFSNWFVGIAVAASFGRARFFSWMAHRPSHCQQASVPAITANPLDL